LTMNDAQRTNARKRFENWQKVSERRRAVIRQRWQEFQSLPEAEQVRIRAEFREYMRLSEGRRAELRRQWQQKSAAERQQILRQLRQQRRERLQQER